MFKVFDIEATEWNRIYAIGIYDGKDILINTDDDKNNDYYIGWLFDNLSDGDIVYAHYGGKYDFTFIMDYMRKHGKISDFRVIHSFIVSFSVKIDDKNITFRDSFNILPSSLLKLTNDFNVEHKKLKMDYELGKKDKGFEEYFKNDLIGLYEVLSDAIELTDKLTIASNSMNVFLDKFYKEKISGNYIKFDNIFRYGYYGGRVEIFKMLGSNLYYYDVNSLYPYVMQQFKYPIIKTNNYEYVSEYVPDKLGIYKIDVIVPDGLNIPVLPYRNSGKLLFPSGKFSGFYYSPEISKAIEMGYKINIRYGYIFKETDYIFREFVNYYYNIKKNAKGSKREIAKLYMNSLYGKFGQRREQEVYSVVPADDYKFKETEVIYPFSKFKIIRQKKVIFNPYIHSEIAGLVTSYARTHLYSIMQKCGFENIYYCDTDSIITSEKLPISDELGKLKLEDKIDEFIAISPKVYAYTINGVEHIKAKGIRSSSIKYSDFKNAINNRDLSAFTSTFERLATFKEHNIRHLENYSDKVKVKKMLKSFYDKRKITSNFNTKPIIVWV